MNQSNNPYDKFIADAAREYMKVYYEKILKNLQADDQLINAWNKLQNMILAENEGKNPQLINLINKEEA